MSSLLGNRHLAYLGQSAAGFFFANDNFTASRQLPLILSTPGLGPGISRFLGPALLAFCHSFSKILDGLANFPLQNAPELDRPSVERYQGTKMAPRSNKRPAAFPCAKIESALREWWNQYTSSSLTRRRSPRECRRAGGTVFEIQPEISSFQAVLAMLPLEPLLGFRLPKSTILRGDYNDREEFVQDVTSWLKAEYTKRSGANTKHR